MLAYCQKDPMLSKIFDCYRVQRSVYNYRMEHGSSEPLASLFTQEKVNLAGAIDIGLNLWVRRVRMPRDSATESATASSKRST